MGYADRTRGGPCWTSPPVRSQPTKLQVGSPLPPPVDAHRRLPISHAGTTWRIARFFAREPAQQPVSLAQLPFASREVLPVAGASRCERICCAPVLGLHYASVVPPRRVQVPREACATSPCFPRGSCPRCSGRVPESRHYAVEGEVCEDRRARGRKLRQSGWRVAPLGWLPQGPRQSCPFRGRVTEGVLRHRGGDGRHDRPEWSGRTELLHAAWGAEDGG